jgi:hypothetical protein
MGPVGFGALLAAVLLVLIAALVIQGAVRRRGGDTVAYLVDAAADFVHGHLSSAAASRVDRTAVKQVLEWQIHYQQVVAPRQGEPRPVVGSGEAMDYVLDRAEAARLDIDPVDVAEIMAAEVEYLLTIGAVGPPVTGGIE